MATQQNSEILSRFLRTTELGEHFSESRFNISRELGSGNFSAILVVKNPLGLYGREVRPGEKLSVTFIDGEIERII